MRDLIESRFGFNPIQWNVWMVLGFLLVWSLVVACAVHSIFHQALDRKQQKFWMWMVIAVPVLGLLCYLPFSFEWDRNAYFLAWRKKKEKTEKSPRHDGRPSPG